MSRELAAFLQSLGRSAVLQTAAARWPHAQPGSMGDWSAKAAQAELWDAAITAQNPHGRVIISATGWFDVELDDIANWHPFIAIAGEGAGRSIRVETRYRYDGTDVSDGELATYDATFGRYIRLGTASDGTLSGNGRRSLIHVVALDGQPWSIADAWVGWVQSA